LENIIRTLSILLCSLGAASDNFLHPCLDASRSGAVDGTLGVRSADRSNAFENTLSDGGFEWRRVAVDARGNDCGPKHTIYIALAGLEAG
jgi:hypothetical protein